MVALPSRVPGKHLAFACVEWTIWGDVASSCALVPVGRGRVMRCVVGGADEEGASWGRIGCRSEHEGGEGCVPASRVCPPRARSQHCPDGVRVDCRVWSGQGAVGSEHACEADGWARTAKTSVEHRRSVRRELWGRGCEGSTCRRPASCVRGATAAVRHVDTFWRSRHTTTKPSALWFRDEAG